jgi:hypothetical protein
MPVVTRFCSCAPACDVLLERFAMSDSAVLMMALAFAVSSWLFVALCGALMGDQS